MVVHSCFNSLDGGCFPSFFFLRGNEPFWLAHHKHKPETLVAPQNKSFHWQMECLPRWLGYKAEEGRTLGKAYGIKVWFYWGHIEDHVGNSMRTENPKKPLSPRPKRKQIGPLSIYVEPFPWLHQIIISKTVCHHFSPGLLEGMGCTLYGRI